MLKLEPIITKSPVNSNWTIMYFKYQGKILPGCYAIWDKTDLVHKSWED